MQLDKPKGLIVKRTTTCSASHVQEGPLMYWCPLISLRRVFFLRFLKLLSIITNCLYSRPSLANRRRVWDRTISIQFRLRQHGWENILRPENVHRIQPTYFANDFGGILVQIYFSSRPQTPQILSTDVESNMGARNLSPYVWPMHILTGTHN